MTTTDVQGYKVLYLPECRYRQDNPLYLLSGTSSEQVEGHVDSPFCHQIPGQSPIYDAESIRT